MTTKFPSPLLGYNNNVRHKGKVFHIQTEDSGVKYGHIITHLFMDGGRILKSVKTGYAEYIGNERMADIVREMMKQQHKAMFIALRDGKFDVLAEGGADASQATRALSADAALVIKLPEEDPAAVAAVPPPPAPAPKPRSVTPPPLIEDAPATLRQPPPGELTLDIGALERAAELSQNASPARRSASELPPPPANLFRDKRGGSGSYRFTPPAPAVVPQVPPMPRAPATSPGVGGPPTAALLAQARKPSQAGLAAAGERRYAPTRPAAVFGQARPQQSKSVFGEDLISDKSLDEVILSYLAEDLEEKK
jgi:hypothetical protein